MKRDVKFYLKLFSSTFYLSAFTFGGGYVIIPLMRRKFVNEYQWIEENEMLDLTAIAQSTPGAIAVNAAILVGYRLAGFLGSLITIIATILPPLIILSFVSIAYTAFIHNLLIKYILRGMQAGVAAIIIDVVINMVMGLVKERKIIPILIMIGAFIAVSIFKINVIIIILISGLIGIITLWYSNYVKKCGETK